MTFRYFLRERAESLRTGSLTLRQAGIVVARPGAGLCKAKGKNEFAASWRVFLWALGLRLFFLNLGRMYVFRAAVDHVAFGSEAGHIARALLTGRGYSDPFWWGHSGPTAWLMPGYPLLLAAVFKLFGIFSNPSAWVVMTLQCIFNAAIARWVWEIGARTVGERAGRWAGWIWAVSPWAMLYALLLPWETAITAAIFIWTLVLTLRLRSLDVGYAWRRWAAWGGCWGAIAMLNPSLLSFLPCAGIWLLRGRQGTLRRRLAGEAVAGTIFVLMLMPWWIRNERTFHKFIPTRANLGAEIADGNNYGVHGVIGQWDHPNLSEEQMDRYRREGEVAFDRERSADFHRVLRARPWEFAEMTLLRVDFFWFGVQRPMEHFVGDAVCVGLYAATSLAGLWGVWLAWRRRVFGASLFAMAMLTMPAVYYMVATQERFRHPLEPLLYLCGVYAVQAAEKSWRVRWFAVRRRVVEAAELDWTADWAAGRTA